MSLTVTSEFEGRWSTFWATTYTFDLAFFDQFLFRRLGDPPLSVNILADHDRLVSLWNDAQATPWLLRRANRDYLIRGVRLSNGRFHPKTYFFANRDRGLLLVGSGNLGMRGLADGNEVFCRFDSRVPEELDVIRSWHIWLNQIIVRNDDQALAVRWSSMVQQAPWLPGVAPGSVFVSNVERNFIDQLADEVGAPSTDELHVYAPFFDADAAALEALVRRFAPRELHLYQAVGMNVDGAKVRAMVERAGVSLRLFGFDHDNFVHAKLFGVVLGNDGFLLSGSPNCSRAALLKTSDQGNAEVAIMVRLPAAALRSAFCRSDWTLTERSPAELNAWTYIPELKMESPWKLRLMSASWHADGAISVLVNGPDLLDGARLATGVDRSYPLVNSRTPTGIQLEEHERLGWILDSAGQRCSNAVPIDDVQKLASWLGDHHLDSVRPRELHQRDLETPLGALLQWLHQEYILDVEESPSLAGFARGALEPSDEQEADAGFWDRVQSEELLLDPRATRYGRLTNFTGADRGVVEDDDVFLLLQMMLGQVPGEHHLIPHSGSQIEGNNEGTGRTWTPNHSVQVRFGNVLKRWSRALGDERLRWLSPYAAVRNYGALLAALVQCRSYGYLRTDRVADITKELIRSFVGEQQHPGYLLKLQVNEREQAMKLLIANDAEAMAAALIYAILQPESHWEQVAFEWQPMLVQAITLGVIAAGEGSPELLEAMSLPTRTPQQIDAHLQRVMTYMNDNRWCAIIEKDLALDRVKLDWNNTNQVYPLTVVVDGILDTLNDPRLVSLVRRALTYRKPEGIMVQIANGDRLSFRRGGIAYARVAQQQFESYDAITDDLMSMLEDLNAGWTSELKEIE